MDLERRLRKDLDKHIDDAAKGIPLPKAGYRDSALTLWGSGSHLSIVVPLEAAEVIHSGFGAYGTCTFGYIRDKDDLSEENFSRAPTSVGLTADRHMKTEFNFDLDVAFLRPEGRTRVREMCALELPWFHHRDAILEITGNCDRIAGSAYNQPLSEHRARNVLQAIRETLGPNLQLKEENIVVRGLGDEEARRYPDEGLISEKRRRVDVRLNGRLVLSLLGAE